MPSFVAQNEGTMKAFMKTLKSKGLIDAKIIHIYQVRPKFEVWLLPQLGAKRAGFSVGATPKELALWNEPNFPALMHARWESTLTKIDSQCVFSRAERRPGDVAKKRHGAPCVNWNTDIDCHFYHYAVLEPVTLLVSVVLSLLSTFKMGSKHLQYLIWLKL